MPLCCGSPCTTRCVRQANARRLCQGGAPIFSVRVAPSTFVATSTYLQAAQAWQQGRMHTINPLQHTLLGAPRTLKA